MNRAQECLRKTVTGNGHRWPNLGEVLSSLVVFSSEVLHGLTGWHQRLMLRLMLMMVMTMMVTTTSYYYCCCYYYYMW